jgi:hypothetical protein
VSELIARVVHPPNTIPQGQDAHPLPKHVAVDDRGFLQFSPETSGYDLAEQVFKVAMYVWDADALQWVRGTSTGGGGGSPTVALRSKRYDIGETTIYIGEADPGIAEGTPAWRIKRITLAGGIPVDMKFANAGALTATWSNRASESYT